jgi:hypothetical protein
MTVSAGSQLTPPRAKKDAVFIVRLLRGNKLTSKVIVRGHRVGV